MLAHFLITWHRVSAALTDSTSTLCGHFTWPEWLQKPGPSPSRRVTGGLGRVHGPTGFHVSPRVLHGGDRHHGDQRALLECAIRRQDFSVAFFTTACPGLQENKEIPPGHTGGFRRHNMPDLNRALSGGFATHNFCLRHIKNITLFVPHPSLFSQGKQAHSELFILIRGEVPK